MHPDLFRGLALAALLIISGCHQPAVLSNSASSISPAKPDALESAGQARIDLYKARAHWVGADTIVWPGPATDSLFALHYDVNANLEASAQAIGSSDRLTLSLSPEGLPTQLQKKFPHLAALTTLKISEQDRHLIPQILRSQLAVTARNAEGQLTDISGVQIAGVLDELFTYEGMLGPQYRSGEITLALWAPTAQDVKLHLFPGADNTSPEVVSMEYNPASGVWSANGTADWDRQYYLFAVKVFAPSTGKIETNLVTDPYSLSLSPDSLRSQLINLSDTDLAPERWTRLQKPRLRAPEDIVLYELHVRDFSIADDRVDPAVRGTFAAFSDPGSRGMQHLRALANAGVTHLHLLPSFDIATVPERLVEQRTIDPKLLDSYAANSAQQQAAIEQIKESDGFNWGYDPFHYTVPEGSYATNPEGSQRVLEYRNMVEALNQAGLRVVMDVVYNHTHAAGQHAKSVLDRIVPGYYHRLNAQGEVETSTCCPNTATEHAMMEKLMIDSVLTWARAYKVDGFRFDLMGHHGKSSMVKLRAALDALTIDKDGVDGKRIYLYGEGWSFGEVANDSRFAQASQANMGGTGIGTFSDRLRDGVRGGTPFGDPREQGFVNGLGFDRNEFDNHPGDRLSQLLRVADWIRVGLAADLADFRFTNAAGAHVRSDEIDYLGQPAGYTQDPQESITYAAAHDNETLFDANQLKLPSTVTLDDRIRVQNLSNAIVMLGQGIPFFHAGQEFLRSKSMDRDSFNSGDWFNAIDWSFETSNWGKGLPIAEKNQDKWPLMGPLLADPRINPNQKSMRRSIAYFSAIARIRKTTPLLRLRSRQSIKDAVRFHNTGPEQIPGLIVMTVRDEQAWVLNFFNARKEAVDFDLAQLDGVVMTLHPALHQLFQDDREFYAEVSRKVTDGRFVVPARSALTYQSIR